MAFIKLSPYYFKLAFIWELMKYYSPVFNYLAGVMQAATATFKNDRSIYAYQLAGQFIHKYEAIYLEIQ